LARTIERARGLVALCLALTLGLTMLSRGAVMAQSGTSAASPAAAATTFTISGLVETPMTLSVADLQKLPARTVNVTFKSGSGDQAHTFTGALLSDVLNQAKLKLDPKIKNDQLRFFAVVTANDGYATVISWGEIDPSFGDQPVLLAWQQDGKALTGTSGPVRLVTPGDIKGGRYVTGVVSIDVRSSDSGS
jgi:DMSO/TMAO reductase YedYZ molybdopterin-dependent catalytic subunit